MSSGLRLRSTPLKMANEGNGCCFTRSPSSEFVANSVPEPLFTGVPYVVYAFSASKTSQSRRRKCSCARVYDLLKRVCELGVHTTIHESIHLVAIFEHFVGVVFEVFLGHVGQTILCKLDACRLESSLFDVVLVDRHLVCFNKLLLNEMPAEFFEALLEVLFYEFFALVSILQLP